MNVLNSNTVSRSNLARCIFSPFFLFPPFFKDAEASIPSDFPLPLCLQMNNEQTAAVTVSQFLCQQVRILTKHMYAALQAQISPWQPCTGIIIPPLSSWTDWRCQKETWKSHQGTSAKTCLQKLSILIVGPVKSINQSPWMPHDQKSFW